jgi:Xaa-Pro aminopeptidase
VPGRLRRDRIPSKTFFMCTHSGELYAMRRAVVLDAIAKQGDDAVLVLPATPVFPRNNDVDHDYRQDSDLHYLTGFAEPESILVLSARGRKTTMFVRPRDAEREVWDGPRAGVEGAKAIYGADEAFNVKDVEEGLAKLFENVSRVYYRLGRNRAFDETLLRAIDKTRSRFRTGVFWPTQIIDTAEVVHEMRLFKATSDLDAMKNAAAITGEAHMRAMRTAKAGMHEFEVEALLLETFRKRGSERPAYGSIVGSGANATVLHYRQNNRKMESGELLLIDAGCEYDYFASDVTRTFPLSGKFTKEQQAIYELVLESQEAGIEACRPGTTLEAVHLASVRVLVEGLVRLRLLSGSVDEIIEKERYKTFYMHRTSHWLGMDVHDVGAYFLAGKPRKLEPQMVLTVEPGIYIAADCDAVAPEWRGIGVRIEDDILVTEGAPTNLTASIPKTVSEVEKACAA